MSLLELYEAKLKAEKEKPKSLLELVEEKMRKKSTPSLLEAVTKRVIDGRASCNREAFDKYVLQHRPHQVAALNSIKGTTQGQIIIPTGTGKTRIQTHIHVEDMLEKSEAKVKGVYVIGAHRLLLCAQLMDNLRDLCIQCGIPVNVLYIGSARHDDKPIYERYFAQGINQDTFESTFTTSMDDIIDFHNKTRSQERHLIVVSTYHSFDRLKAIPEIDICTYDEAHTTIAEDFSENIFETVKPLIKRNYFFTATRRVRGNQFGMNDKEKYGDILCAIPPREMIEAGEVVMPRLHIMSLDHPDKETVSDDNEAMLVRTVIEGFTEHKEKLKQDSAYPDAVGAKLLVSCKGSDELKMVQDNFVFKDWCRDNNVKVFSFSSRFGNYEDFEEEQNRSKIYESLRHLKDTEDAIFLHIDILTEGIDLPSITAVMLLRHLNTSKLIQTLGRALRLLSLDRSKLYGGIIQPHERNKYAKPYAYVLLPMHFETLNASSLEMKVMLRRIISEYGVPTEEFLPVEEFKAKATTDMPDTVTAPGEERRRKEKEYPLLHLIEDFVLDKFGEKLPEDKLERYSHITELLKGMEAHYDENSRACEKALCDLLSDF